MKELIGKDGISWERPSLLNMAELRKNDGVPRITKLLPITSKADHPDLHLLSQPVPESDLPC